MIDPTQAPPGMHTAYAWHVVPYDPGGDPANAEAYRDPFVFMGAFSSDQVMGNRFGYRTPIDGLYYAGSAAHPGGAISGGAGYIVAGLICADLGVKPWWTPVDARSALERFTDLRLAGSTP